MTDAREPVKQLFQETRLRNGEASALEAIYHNFETFPATTREKLENFPNWVRHRDLARFIFKTDIYRSIVHTPGAVFECGVLLGGGLTTWMHLGEIFEPVNYGRKVFGFDTFSGFPDISENDIPDQPKNPELYQPGTYSAASAEEHLDGLIPLIDRTRKIPQFKRGHIIKGDICETLPELLSSDKSLLIALLYLDLDLYKPTRVALETCLPRMCKGAVICIDELCYHDWPGETEAVYDFFDMNKLTIERSPLVPNIGVIRI